jgi:hypothetical protein
LSWVSKEAHNKIRCQEYYALLLVFKFFCKLRKRTYVKSWVGLI